MNKTMKFGGMAAVAVVATLSLTGCKWGDSDHKVQGQSVAEIDGEDVTVSQLDYEMRVLGVPDDKRTDDVKRRALAEILARKYMAHQAVADKVDRDPSISMGIDRQREETLARAFSRHRLSAQTETIGKSETDRYIGTHPNIFSDHKVFSVREIIFGATPDIAEIAKETVKAKTLDEIRAILDRHAVKYTTSYADIDGASLPESVLATVEARKPDDVFFSNVSNKAVFFKVESEQVMPPSADKAEAIARGQLQREILKDGLSSSEEAAIKSAVYVGDYAKLMEPVLKEGGLKALFTNDVNKKPEQADQGDKQPVQVDKKSN
jgi:EpsD family peptidyl-prolyl cis-trans isomerase